MELKQLFERTTDIRTATPSATTRQRLAEVAADISRAGDNQARVELLNESCLALTTILYAGDAEGRFANIDSRTYRLLVPAPWGANGWRKWGLRKWEGLILRQILIVRCQMRRVAPLFDYSDELNQWYLAADQYPDLSRAMAYWKAYPITLKEWRLHADGYRADARKRMAKNRNTQGSE